MPSAQCLKQTSNIVHPHMLGDDGPQDKQEACRDADSRPTAPENSLVNGRSHRAVALTALAGLVVGFTPAPFEAKFSRWVQGRAARPLALWCIAYPVILTTGLVRTVLSSQTLLSPVTISSLGLVATYCAGLLWLWRGEHKVISSFTFLAHITRAALLLFWGWKAKYLPGWHANVHHAGASMVLNVMYRLFEPVSCIYHACLHGACSHA